MLLQMLYITIKIFDVQQNLKSKFVKKIKQFIYFNMAAIDKMYLKDYYVFDEFRLWCLVHNPKLLRHFYHWNSTQQEWDNWKESIYNNHKEINELLISYSSTIESLQDHYKKSCYIASYEEIVDEVAECLEQHEALKNKQTYLENIALPVTNFSCKEDKYLLWHCPIEEVREYLTKQCGYKERWYYKLFFKY